jgi:hypothetical protein
LCCDGTLFDMIQAAPEEDERLRDLKIETSEHSGKRYFAMPCRFSCEGRCTIYADRFKTCHSFRCKVLSDYQSGALTSDQAQEKVRTALKLRADVASCDPSAARVSERKRLRAESVPPDKGRRPLLLKIVALDYFLDMHFRTENPQVARGQDANLTIRP